MLRRFCHWGRRIFLSPASADQIAAPKQNIQQSRTLQVVQKHFAHADIERPAGAFISCLNLFSGWRVRSGAGLPEFIRRIQEVITAAAKMIKTKSFLTKGSNDRPRATAPIATLRIMHCRLFPLIPMDSFTTAFCRLSIARNSSRSDDFNQFGNLGWSKVGQRKLRGFFWKQDMGYAGTRMQATVCKLRDNF
jgi:hypothetical protein